MVVRVKVGYTTLDYRVYLNLAHTILGIWSGSACCCIELTKVHVPNALQALFKVSKQAHNVH